MKEIIIDDILAELEQEQYDYIEEKNAFDLNLMPGTVIGALTGAFVANKTMKGINNNAIKKVENSQAIGGNYYSQAQNILDNLKVIFTPLGVIYVVKNGNKEITIDTIDSDKMTEEMYSAWQTKNYNYFRNLIINKMYSEIQFVERMYAKKMIEAQNFIHKSAADDVSNMTDFEVDEFIDNLQEMHEEDPETIGKFASVMETMFEPITISLKLSDSLDKYAGIVSSALNVVGIDTGKGRINSMQGKFLNPSYLKGRVNIGFMPDRVIFAVDNMLVSTLFAMDMNEEAFQAFEAKDKKYFNDLFDKEVIRGLARMKGRIPAKFQIEKKAASENVSSIFQDNSIHPTVYFLELCKKYGKAWFDFDTFVLIKTIEKDYGLNEEGIWDIPMNKILSIKVINCSLVPYESFHAFEKIIRSFADKPIDFLKRESSGITASDLAFGIQTIEDTTPYDDVYDNFSAEVFEHVADIMIENNNYVYLPEIKTKDAFEETFIRILNYTIADKANIDSSLWECVKIVYDKYKTTVINAVTQADIEKVLEQNEKDINLASSVLVELRKTIDLNNILKMKQTMLDSQAKQFKLL